MADNQQILEDTMTLLMSVTPETTLGKLLNLCLAAKADKSISKSAREFAQELLKDPSKINYWTMDVIGSDANYTEQEWKALSEMKLEEYDDFATDLQSELKSLDLD